MTMLPSLRRLAAALLLAGLWAGAAGAETLAEKVREQTLANGLKLLVVERHDAPTFTAYITIGVGSVDEPGGSRGVAHLLEHMLFKGTETLGTSDYRRERPLLEQIERVGSELDALRVRKGADPLQVAELTKRLSELQEQARRYVVKDEFSRLYAENGGVGYNAFTSKDLTTYLVSLPANKLELWAAIESDRMQHAVLREFYTEREVVREERRRSYESEPDGMLYENLVATAFTVHPYRHPIIGWGSDIENLSLAATRDFLQRYYAPVNTVIALVGDLDADAAMATVARYFGGIPAGTPVPPVTAVEPPQRGEKRIHVQFEAEPQLAVAFHKPTLPARDDYVFDLIDLILAQGRTSRLYRSLVVERQLATAVGTYGAPGARYPNLFVVSATTPPSAHRRRGRGGHPCRAGAAGTRAGFERGAGAGAHPAAGRPAAPAQGERGAGRDAHLLPERRRRLALSGDLRPRGRQRHRRGGHAGGPYLFHRRQPHRGDPRQGG
jgi:predicted Zn-dependent peptidase